MLRRLYRCAVRLHPSRFRQRFGDEMLYIFDQQRGALDALGVTLDCVFSLLRQWTLRPHTRTELAAPALRSPAPDHIPSFESFDTVLPRTSAIFHGTLLSLIVFYMTVIAIPYSWIHVLHLRYPYANEPTQPHSRGSKVDVVRPEDVTPTEGDDRQSKAIASSLAPVAPVQPHAVEILLDAYVGRYISKYPPEKISIQIEGDYPSPHLSISLAAAGHPSLALSPVSPMKFVIIGAENSYVDFTADAAGKIRSLSWVVNGKVITAQRQ